MTRESIFLCEAAGYDRIIVETVGIGQSETSVATLSDLVVFVTMSGSGDALQGIKRGIMEVIDLVAVNKSDGENEQLSKNFASELTAALHLLHGSAEPPSVLLTSAATKLGLDGLLEQIESQIKLSVSTGDFSSKRKKQLELWFEQATTHSLTQNLRRVADVSELHSDLLRQVKDGSIHPFVAANLLVSKLLSPLN